MIHIGRWLRLTAQSVPDGKTVSDVLDEGRLQEIKEEAAKNGE